jgi:adenylate cyclase
MPQIVIEQPGVAPMTFPLTTGEFTLGRSEECDIVLVADEVSRHHAKLVIRPDHALLMDLKSLNGTYVNRQRVVERVLSHQDEIWFGSKCRVIFRNDTQLGQVPIQGSGSDHDSKILEDVRRIRAEMEQVGRSMTMIGRRTPYAGVKTATADSPDMVKMAHAFRRLEAMHSVSRIMTSGFDLDDRLAKVLDRMLDVLEADRGFVMLREEGTNNISVKLAREMGHELAASSPSMGIAGRAAIDGEPVLMGEESNEDERELRMRDSIIQNKIRSAMCVPLKAKDRILGSIYIDTRKDDVTFTREDLELFSSLAHQAALAIDNVQLHEKVVTAEKRRQDFSRFLSPDIVEKIVSEGADLELGGTKAIATTLFCDIRGFTNISEKLTPQAIVELLNEHFTAVTEIIFKHRGTINKFIGDEIMAVFGAPIAIGDEAFRAVCAALEIQAKNKELNGLREYEKRPIVNLGIGIDTGEVSAGYIGSPMRMEYTVIGDKVNTASRLCSHAAAGQTLVGDETWEAVQDRIVGRPTGSVMLKGKERPVHAFEVVSVREGVIEGLSETARMDA